MLYTFCLYLFRYAENLLKSRRSCHFKSGRVAILSASRRSSRVTSGSVAFSVIYVINTYMSCCTRAFYTTSNFLTAFSNSVVLVTSSLVTSGSVAFSVIYVINTCMSYRARSVYTSSNILTAYSNRVVFVMASSLIPVASLSISLNICICFPLKSQNVFLDLQFTLPHKRHSFWKTFLITIWL